MNGKTIKVGEFEITLAATVWTLIEFKRIFKKDWYAARSESLNSMAKALKFQDKYGGLTDEQFEKLPEAEQSIFWQELDSVKVDMDFTLNTIYAMATAGGFSGRQQDLFSRISPKDLAPDSELMQAVAELIEEFTPEVKKNMVLKAK